MPNDSRRALDRSGALCIVLAFGALFVGRVMMYPTALVPGGLLARIRAESAAWDNSHRVMLVGFVLMIPAAYALWTATRARSPRIAFIATSLGVVAAALAIGQFALDFAYLAAARSLPPEAGQALVDDLRGDGFVRAVFYDAPGLWGVAALLYAIALWRNGPAWRPAAVLVGAAIAFGIVESRFAPIGPRITLGLQFAGFSVAAWRICRADSPR